MPRANLKHVTIYLTDRQHADIQKAAADSNRSVSNYLLTLWITYGEEFDSKNAVVGERPAKQSRRKKA